MHRLKEVFELINQLADSGLVKAYAVGGATAALFYAEVSRTYDVDIFISIDSPGVIVDISPVLDWFRARGCEYKGEHLLVFGVPVQILVGAEGLDLEAITNAEMHLYDDVSVRVMRPEYLVCLYTKAGGSKRKERIQFLKDAGVVDQLKLAAIAAKYKIELN